MYGFEDIDKKLMLINNTSIPVIAGLLLFYNDVPYHHFFLFTVAYIALTNVVLFAIYGKPVRNNIIAGLSLIGMQLTVAFIIYLYGLMGF